MINEHEQRVAMCQYPSTEPEVKQIVEKVFERLKELPRDSPENEDWLFTFAFGEEHTNTLYQLDCIILRFAVRASNRRVAHTLLLLSLYIREHDMQGLTETIQGIWRKTHREGVPIRQEQKYSCSNKEKETGESKDAQPMHVDDVIFHLAAFMDETEKTTEADTVTTTTTTTRRKRAASNKDKTQRPEEAVAASSGRQVWHFVLPPGCSPKRMLMVHLPNDVLMQRKLEDVSIWQLENVQTEFLTIDLAREPPSPIFPVLSSIV